MTKNFAELNDIEIFENEDIQNDIFKKIEKIEGLIISGETEFDWVGNSIRVIVEEILLEAFNCEGISLWERIDNLKSKGNYIPTPVLNQLNFVRNISNQESHGLIKKSDRIYKTDFSKEDCILSLRAVWTILIYVLATKHANATSYNFSLKFDRSFYEQSINLEENRNKELDNTNGDIQSNLLSIAQLVMLKDYVFNIPTYQRDYTWKDRNIKKLIDDIEKRNLDGKSHYMGAIAIANDENSKVLRIVDGQQRITTSLILLKAFNDVYLKLKKEPQVELQELIKKIGGIYINQKVLLSQKAVESVLKGNTASTDTTTRSTSAFKNYFKFVEWLTKKENEIDELYATFVSKFQVAVLTFDTSIDNEMDIYENLNTGGEVLNGWELIKNYIFSRLEPKLFIEKESDVNSFVNKKLAQPLSAKTTDQINSKLTTFFTQYVRLQNLIIKRSVLEGREVHETFKELWPRRIKFDNYDDYISELNKIIRYFNIYMEINELYKSNTSPLHIYSHILDFIKKDDIAPLLMFTLEKNCEFTEDNTIKKVKGNAFYSLIKSIESYFIRLWVVSGVGQSQSQIFDKYLLFNSSNISGDSFYTFAEQQMSPKMPSIDEFEEVLASSGSLSRNLIMNILINVEHKLRKMDIKNSTQAPFEKTHEHIIAQNLPYEDYDDKTIDEAKYIELQNRWRDSIGNALILSKGDNSSAGNKPFTYKKKIYEKSSFLSLGNEFIMNLTTKDVFTFEDVEARSKQIAKFAKQIYSK